MYTDRGRSQIVAVIYIWHRMFISEGLYRGEHNMLYVLLNVYINLCVCMHTCMCFYTVQL